MKYLALSLSTYVNVLHTARRHLPPDVPEVPIDAMPNGVTRERGTSPPFSSFLPPLDAVARRHYSLRRSIGLPPEEVGRRHLIAKHDLGSRARKKTVFSVLTKTCSRLVCRALPGYNAPTDSFWTGTAFASRKEPRTIPILSMPQSASERRGRPKDIIAAIFTRKKAPFAPKRPCCVPRVYNLDLRCKITIPASISGSTRRIFSRSLRHSGMKAAINGFQLHSTGWGWKATSDGRHRLAIGRTARSMDSTELATQQAKEAECFTRNSEKTLILPMFYKDPHLYIQVMQTHRDQRRSSNTQRLVQQYITDVICVSVDIGQISSGRTGSNLQSRTSYVQKVRNWIVRRASLSPYPKLFTFAKISKKFQVPYFCFSPASQRLFAHSPIRPS